jgi:hypothetical protein
MAIRRIFLNVVVDSHSAPVRVLEQSDWRIPVSVADQLTVALRQFSGEYGTTVIPRELAAFAQNSLTRFASAAAERLALLFG